MQSNSNAPASWKSRWNAERRRRQGIIRIIYASPRRWIFRVLCCSSSCGLLFLSWNALFLLKWQYSVFKTGHDDHKIDLKIVSTGRTGQGNRNDDFKNNEPFLHPFLPYNQSKPKLEIEPPVFQNDLSDIIIPLALQHQATTSLVQFPVDKRLEEIEQLEKLGLMVTPVSKSKRVIQIPDGSQMFFTLVIFLLYPYNTALSVAAPPALPGQWRGRTHTVVAGETLLGIAATLRVPINAILALNQETVSDPNLIFVGQILRVPEPAALSYTEMVRRPIEMPSSHLTNFRFASNWQVERRRRERRGATTR